MRSINLSTLLNHGSSKDEKRMALNYIHEAFAEAILAGLDTESFAEAAIATGLQELVACYGEDVIALFAMDLPDRVRRGEFTVGSRH